MVAAPVIEEITETFVTMDEDGDIEIIEINEVFEESAEAAEESDEDEVSLATAPIDVVDDKTRPIELPEKSDNELF
jgi:hypothetical protein